MEQAGAWLVRMLLLLAGVAGALLFLTGTIFLTSGHAIAGVLPPTLAIVAGVLLFLLWFVIHLVGSGSVTAKPRRRPR
ncbi:hypothetical protein AAGW05_09670 [Arthrobacter sp. LAPM80]|uniref:hypothetical protein n=1 Tax=Arthrobacter sp. LAPM80 TaxID=3141788 RepID=UPI00398AC760